MLGQAKPISKIDYAGEPSESSRTPLLAFSWRVVNFGDFSKINKACLKWYVGTLEQVFMTNLFYQLFSKML